MCQSNHALGGAAALHNIIHNQHTAAGLQSTLGHGHVLDNLGGAADVIDVDGAAFGNITGVTGDNKRHVKSTRCLHSQRNAAGFNRHNAVRCQLLQTEHKDFTQTHYGFRMAENVGSIKHTAGQDAVRRGEAGSKLFQEGCVILRQMAGDKAHAAGSAGNGFYLAEAVKLQSGFYG